MRKQFLTIITLIGLLGTGISQSSVFILVDVSGSGPKNPDVRIQARNIVRDFCTGQYQDSRYNTTWKWAGAIDPFIEAIKTGQGKALLDPTQDGYLVIMPFGEKNTYLNYKIEKLSTLPAQADHFINQHFPQVYQDQLTYAPIARAKAASLAKGPQINITSYYLIEITDELPDTDSTLPSYSKEEQALIDEYGTQSSNEVKLATLRYTGDKSNYQILFKRVSVVSMKIQGTVPEPIKVSKAKLEIVRPNGGTRKKPVTLASNPISVILKCLGCDSIAVFTVRVDAIDSKGQIKPQVQKISGTQCSFNVTSSGTYKISASTSGIVAEPSYVNINVSGANAGGGGSGILPFLLLLALGGAGYYVWRQRQMREPPSPVYPDGVRRIRPDSNPAPGPEKSEFDEFDKF